VPEQLVISVRGEAERACAPDFVTLHCSITVRADQKVEALEKLAAEQQTLVNRLAELGGAPLTVQTRRAALTWSVGYVGTEDEHDLDKTTGRHGRTGRVIANAHAVITSRALTRLEDLGRALASVPSLHFDGVGWHVDADNEQWRGVRSDAIDAAIAKGRDYAAALGGTVTRVEQIADAGLLAGNHGDEVRRAQAASGSVALSGRGAGPAEFATLDPVPQVIRAVVEARLAAEVESLSEEG
jgi:uncharacterized protein